jgi:MFS transporter, ACS family, pantothenate transporter
VIVSGTADRVDRFHCLVTQPLNYFAVWLKSLNWFSVYQINLFPTAGQALGLVTTLAYAWVSDGLGGKRWQVMIVPAVGIRTSSYGTR